jgi:nicotinate phosphoribosyltransferase
MISPLLTDLYQLTMAYGYWKLGLHDREAVFHLIFRKNPFRGNYAIACGLGTVIDFLSNWRFAEDDIAYLRSLCAANGESLFSIEFLDYLKTVRFTCDIDAIPEGTVVLPHEPLLRIKGPLLQGQLLESTLLNIINFQTLIATKASRVCQAAKGDAVFEFGLRRAQGPDGALSASRAAFVGGVDATSNVLAGKLYDIPVRGTHAHSWVTVFADELSAFDAYAKVMPHNCVLLVDTFDTIQGVKNAIEIGKKIRSEGVELQAIRLDSGDIAGLSIKARELLDAAGFTQTKIIASNSLDEHVISEMKNKGAQVSIWGVGTNLVTSYDHPALDGVYKLSALRDATGQWQYKLKLSEQAIKVSNPGIYQVRRFFTKKSQVLDVMYDVELGISKKPSMVSLDKPHAVTIVEDDDSFTDLLKPIFQNGKLVYPIESVRDLRLRSREQVKQLSSLPILMGLEKNLHELKQKLISEVSLASHEKF